MTRNGTRDRSPALIGPETDRGERECVRSSRPIADGIRHASDGQRTGTREGAEDTAEDGQALVLRL